MICGKKLRTWYKVSTYPVGIYPTTFTPNRVAKLSRYDIAVTTIICTQISATL